MDANALADQISMALETLFERTLKDNVEALIPLRASMGPDNRARLFAALHRVPHDALNTLAALSRDAAWG